jgi:post-segregation antitoxin (ccd killing protein)
MPDVGEDADFARVEDGEDKGLAARQMQKFIMAGRSVDEVDLKALIEDGRTDGAFLDAKIDQMNLSTATAEAAIDDALAELDASIQRIENMERTASGLNLLDTVALLVDVKGWSLAGQEVDLFRGQVGTVIEAIDADVVLVEFAGVDGVAYALATIACQKLIRLHHDWPDAG